MSALENSIYYQFQRAHNYSVFIRVEAGLNEGRIQKLVQDLGFNLVPVADYKKIPFDRMTTKILSITKASVRICQQVNTPDSLDQFGLESLSPRANYQVYLFRRIGMMIVSDYHSVWEMGLVSELENTDELMSMRVMLNRFLSWSLAPLGVIGYWGVTTEDGFIVMKQNQSYGEAVFIDLEKKLVLSSSGSKKLQGQFNIYRSDKVPTHNGPMSREELISFLSTCSTYFSNTGLHYQLKKVAYSLGVMATGLYNNQAKPVNTTLSNL